MPDTIPVILRLRLEQPDFEALKVAAGMMGKSPEQYLADLVHQAMVIERGMPPRNGAA